MRVMARVGVSMSPGCEKTVVVFSTLLLAGTDTCSKKTDVSCFCMRLAHSTSVSHEEGHAVALTSTLTSLALMRRQRLLPFYPAERGRTAVLSKISTSCMEQAAYSSTYLLQAIVAGLLNPILRCLVRVRCRNRAAKSRAGPNAERNTCGNMWQQLKKAKIFLLKGTPSKTIHDGAPLAHLTYLLPPG